MADNRQFGGPKIRQFGDKTMGNQPGDGGDCARCEAMLADALDGTLSTEDQEFFDLHVDHCGPCALGLADARRGAAFLEILRHPAPEPPADMLERILAQTSGVSPIVHPIPAAAHPQQGAAAMASGYSAPSGIPGYGNVVPFPRRFASVLGRSSIGQLMLQPRLAMTAAMAFFSIALTMNMVGIHPTALRPGDLKPTSLNRDFWSARASVVRYYDNLRVVYELESRVHELQNSQDADPTAGSRTTPSNSDQPAGQAPATQPGPADKKAEPQPGGSKPAPGSGSSRREDLTQDLRFVAYTGDEPGFSYGTQVRAGRKLV